MLTKHTFEKLYNLLISPHEDYSCLTEEEQKQLLLEANKCRQQEASLSLISSWISYVSELTGCDARVSTEDFGETVKEFDVKAFTTFAVTFFCVVRSASPLRHADIELSLENGYCVSHMSFHADESNSRVSAALAAFSEYASRRKMRFDWRREKERLTVTFTPVSKDWALLEVKSPVDDEDELIVVD